MYVCLIIILAAGGRDTVVLPWISVAVDLPVAMYIKDRTIIVICISQVIGVTLRPILSRALSICDYSSGYEYAYFDSRYAP